MPREEDRDEAIEALDGIVPVVIERLALTLDTVGRGLDHDDVVWVFRDRVQDRDEGLLAGVAGGLGQEHAGEREPATSDHGFRCGTGNHGLAATWEQEADLGLGDIAADSSA